jgi:LysM repeat protein
MSQFRKRSGLAFILGLALLAAGCDVALPIATQAPPSPGPTHTARPTVIPAVADTATALAIAVASGITPPTPTPSPSPEPATATPLPTETSTPQPTETWVSATPGASRTPILDPTQGSLPPGCTALHTVLPGEWLAQIAELYGVGVDALASANKIADPSTLSAGQVLCIPGSRAQPSASATLSPVPSPTAVPARGLAILSFAASPNPVERGGVVRLSWTLQAASTVTLTAMTYDDNLGVWYRQSAPTYTGTGDAELTVAVAVDARQPLRYELQAADADGAVVSAQTDLLQLLCYPLFFSENTDATFCPHAPRSAPAEFQSFERGFMIWNGDTGDLYILLQDAGRYNYWLLWSPAGKTVEIGLPPAGEFGPGAHFAEAWGTLGPSELGGSLRLRDILGWGTAPPHSFTLTEQVKLDARYPMFDSVYLGWPDGRVAQVYTGAGAPHPGSLGPSWTLFSPAP